MKRVFCSVLAVLFLFGFAACGPGGNDPTGETTTPAPGTTGPIGYTGDPNATTPAATTQPTAPTKPKPEKPVSYDKETKEMIDAVINLLSENEEIDVNKTIKGVYEEYSEFLNEDINEDALKVALTLRAGSYASIANLSGISNNALIKVNDFLESKGLNPLDIKNTAENIKAFLLAASLFYDPNGSWSPYKNLGTAFANARSEDGQLDSMYISQFIGTYMTLGNLSHH